MLFRTNRYHSRYYNKVLKTQINVQVYKEYQGKVLFILKEAVLWWDQFFNSNSNFFKIFDIFLSQTLHKQ